MLSLSRHSVWLVLLSLLVRDTHSLLSRTSQLNKFELDNINYQIEIDNSLIELDSKFKQPDSSNDVTTTSSLVRVRSVYGQVYECKLPDVTSALNQMNSDSQKEDDTAESLANMIPSSMLSMFDTSSVPVVSKSQHNFTFIGEKIKEQMQALKRAELCVYRNLGWWTYEFCFGQHATQYHALANGSIEGDKINLGHHFGDLNWQGFNESSSNLPVSSGVFYHEQYYEMGSLCELNQKPRRTVVKFFCDESTSGQIDLINEIETCVYEIHIVTQYVCSIPNFSKKPINYDISCHPVVEPNDYNSYLSIQEARKKRDEVKKEEPKSVDQEDNSKIKDVDDAVIESEDHEYNELVSSDIDSLDSQLREDLTNTETAVNELKESAKRFDDLVNKVMTNIKNKDAQALEEQLAEAQELLADSMESFLKNEKLTNTISQRLNTLIDDLDNQDDEYHDDSLDGIDEGDLPTTKSRLSLINKAVKENQGKSKEDLLKLEEESNPESKSRIKELERALEKKLSKTDNANNKIKVKIVTLDKSGNVVEDDSLSDIEPESLSSLITSLFEHQRQKQHVKKLQKSYNFVFNQDKNQLLTQSGEYDDDDISLDIFDDEFLLDTTGEQSDENDDKLIIY